MPLTLTQICEAIISETMINYRGRVIQMENSHKYRVGRNYYTSLKEAKEAVDNSFKSLQNSIRKPL